jgi:LmeA-like phospholipid-binding
VVLRWVRRAILFWILFVVAFLLAADFGLRIVAQYLVARELQTALALQERPKVSFGGWPFVAELASGEIATITVSATGAVTSDAFPTQSVDATMHDVKVSIGDLISGSNQKLTAKTGGGTLVMTEDDVNAALASDLGVTVDLKNGKVLLTSDQVKGSVTATARISKGKLILEGDQLPAVELPLPEVADGLTFTDVSIAGDQAVLTFALKNASFQT